VPHRVLLDVHGPLAVADALRRRGIDVITAQEEGLSLSDDESLLEQSSAQERVLVTQDADFLEIVPRWRREGRASRGVIFARQGMPIGIFVEDVELCLVGLADDELFNQVVFIPLR
jgi:hypothetical protein